MTEIGNSPIQTVHDGDHGPAAGHDLQGEGHARRSRCPTCARVHLHGRDHDGDEEASSAVPIQALTVREMLFNDKGELVHEPPPKKRSATSNRRVSASNEPPPGHTRKETEGVFVIRDGRAVFTPVKIGIAGEKYFEVVCGLKAGDQVITGPFAIVRDAGRRRTGPARRTATPSNARHPARVTVRHEPDPRLRPDRASGDLGEQAPLAADGARQHRRRHVDRDRGVADPGHERVRVATRSSATSAPTRSRSSGCRRSGHEEDEERMRANPRITMAEARRDQADQRQHHGGDGAGAEQRHACRIATQEIENVSIQGVTSEYVDFGTFNADERGRMMSADGSRPQPAGRRSSASTSPTGCSATSSPLDKDDQDRRHPVPRRRRQREEGLGRSATRRTTSR